MMFHWFPNYLLYIDHGNTKFAHFYDREAKKLILKIFQMECKADSNENKNNNKKIDLDNQRFWEIYFKRNNFIY